MKNTILYIISFLLIPVLSFSCPKVINDTSKVQKWLIYGKPGSNSKNTPKYVIHKWNLEIFRVAGCRVSQKLRDSVKKENAKVDSIMNLQFGNDWDERYFTEVHQENDILKEIEVKLHKLQCFKKFMLNNSTPNYVIKKDDIENKYFLFFVSHFSQNSYELVFKIQGKKILVLKGCE